MSDSKIWPIPLAVPPDSFDASGDTSDWQAFTEWKTGDPLPDLVFVDRCRVACEYTRGVYAQCILKAGHEPERRHLLITHRNGEEWRKAIQEAMR